MHGQKKLGNDRYIILIWTISLILVACSSTVKDKTYFFDYEIGAEMVSSDLFVNFTDTIVSGKKKSVLNFGTKKSFNSEHGEPNFAPFFEFRGLIKVESDSVFLIDQYRKQLLFLLTDNRGKLCENILTRYCMKFSDTTMCDELKYDVHLDSVYWSESLKDTIYLHSYRGIGSDIDFMPYFNNVKIGVSKRYFISRFEYVYLKNPFED